MNVYRDRNARFQASAAKQGLMALEDGTDRLSRNVGKELLKLAA
jgi:hypothetical protein